jgi:flagellar hook protein FlgE
MGWTADSAGNVDTQAPMTALAIPFGTQISAQPTADIAGPPAKNGMVLAGNLDSGTAAGGTATSTVTAYDSLGNAHTIRLTFTKNAAPNTWDVTGLFDDNDVNTAMDNNAMAPASQALTFSATGQVTALPATNGLLTMSLASMGTGATDPLTFTVDVRNFTQFAGASQVNLSSQTGSPAGALVSFAVGNSGEVSGIYSNGSNKVIGQLALASFVNPGGLQRSGQNLWAPSGNSGEPILGAPNTNGRGTVSTGTLETSNVDLAQQFTNIIIAQRGFQSSSRVITAGDQMLQDLVNIIR